MNKNIFEIILDSIAPDYCYFCGEIGQAVCDNCMNKDYNFGITINNYHKNIKKEFFLASRYGEIKQMVDEFKFQNKKQNARYLSYFLVKFLKNNKEFSGNDKKITIVPVPTSSKHIRSRGIDHTKILAKYLSKDMNIDISNIILRISNSVQHNANYEQRQVQSKDSYKINGKIDVNTIYVILDDIKTTGATIDSIADILSKNGAKEIWGVYLLHQEI